MLIEVYIHTNNMDLPPVIAVEFWKGSLFDVGVS